MTDVGRECSMTRGGGARLSPATAGAPPQARITSATYATSGRASTVRASAG